MLTVEDQNFIILLAKNVINYMAYWFVFLFVGYKMVVAILNLIEDLFKYPFKKKKVLE